MTRRYRLIVLALGMLAGMTGCGHTASEPTAMLPRGFPPLPPGAYIDPATVRWGQHALQVAGFDPGIVDGELTPGTRAALADFQRAKGLPATAALDDRTLRYLSLATGLRAPGDPPNR